MDKPRSSVKYKARLCAYSKLYRKQMNIKNMKTKLKLHRLTMRNIELGDSIDYLYHEIAILRSLII